MVWTPDTRRDYARDRKGYASDMTDREWGRIKAPFTAARINGKAAYNLFAGL